MRMLLSIVSTILMTMNPIRAEEKLPGIELRVKSVNELVGYFEYLGGLAGQGEQGKQFADLIKAFGGDKGVIEGVDLKRPLGGYAVFSPGMVDSQFVVMVPVSDEKAFIGLLKSRLSLDPKSQGDGVYQIAVPKVPTPFFLRVHDGYACVTVLDAKHLDPKGLLEPKAFFAVKDDAIVSVNVHIDRVPAEFRKVFLAQLELQLHDRTAGAKDANSAYKFGYWMGLDGSMRAMTCLFEEGRTLSLKLNVAPKTDDLALTATLTAKDGSDFAKTLKSLPVRPAQAALAAAVDNPVASFALQAGVPESMRKELAKRLDEILSEAAKNAGAQKDIVERILESFAPTLKAGDYELGVAISGEPADGKLKLVAAAKATGGKEVEKLAEEFASFIPADQGKFEFDVAKLPSGSLHKITVPNEDLRRLYGSETVWAGIGDSLFVLGFEPKSHETIRVAGLKPGVSDVLNLRIAGTRLLLLVDPSTEAGTIKDAEIEVFGDGVKSGADQAELFIRGGEQLTIGLKVKGKLLEFLTKVDAKKKAK